MIHKLTYNNRVLSEEEREDYCRTADEYIDQFSGFIEEGFQLAKEAASVSGNSEFTEINKIISDISAFTTYAFGDCIVLDKLFIRAKHPYEKSLLRGKLKVHLNESFKKLYGFKKGYKASYCAQLEQLITRFSPDSKSLSKNCWLFWSKYPRILGGKMNETLKYISMPLNYMNYDTKKSMKAKLLWRQRN